MVICSGFFMMVLVMMEEVEVSKHEAVLQLMKGSESVEGGNGFGRVDFIALKEG